MIIHDVQAEELEPNPEDKFAIKECFVDYTNKNYVRSKCNKPTGQHRLVQGRQFDWDLPGGLNKVGHEEPRVLMTDICPYAHEGIEPQLRLNSDPPSLQAPEDDAIVLQDDNARPHSDRNVDAYLELERIQCMQWLLDHRISTLSSCLGRYRKTLSTALKEQCG
ncbi:uncharacterized protein TNCV_2225211 [Trichonephila clavipes]|nr:uncharacterized protein TNCV_2225211 [Trichonephila clavipes]